MKALTLRQPWASLVIAGKKTIETRSWSTKYRGPLLLHAAAKVTREAELFWRGFPWKGGIGALRVTEMPRAMVIGKCMLTACLLITPELTVGLTEMEIYCGDYRSGRYAWYLRDITPLRAPVPAKGQLGLWDYEGLTEEEEG